MDNRRLFLAFLLSMVVIFAWYTLFPPKPAQRPPVEPEARQEAPVAPAPSGEGGAPARPAEPQADPATPPGQRI
ncbi:membrane protein insertase YidC, partial [bacterium]